MMGGAGGEGWKSDPTGGHEFRYHDGAAFTGYVSDNGTVTTETPTTWWDPADGYAPNPGLLRWGYQDSYFSSQPAPRRRTGLTVAITVAALEAAAIVALCVALIAGSSTSATTSVASPTFAPTTPTTPITLPVTSTTLTPPIGSKVPSSGSLSQNMGAVVYSSNFGANDGWNTGAIENDTAATVSKNQYLVTGSTMFHHALTVPYDIAHNGMSVEVGATGYPQDNVSVGAGCQSAGSLSPGLVYQIVVYPSGQWFIEEARLPGGVETLVSGEVPPLGPATSLQLSCVMTPSGSGVVTTQLMGSINGAEVGAIGDQVDQVDVGGYVPVLVLGTFGPKVTVAFTNVTVRSVDASS